MSEEKLTDMEQAFEELKQVEHLISINSTFLAKYHLKNALKIINNKIGEEIDEQPKSSIAEC